MNYPAFYDLAPRISMYDPLSALLGASSGGVLEYTYSDAVRLAGHSCPTVAGAYLIARAAMLELYRDEPAERGGIRVRMPAPESEGAMGVTAQVLTLITGAAADNGFHGIGGRFVRRSLLSYSTSAAGRAVYFSRQDSGATVSVELDLATVPAPANLHELMSAALDPTATVAQRKAFALEWQGRVQRLLVDHADDPQVLRVERLS